MFRPLRNSEVSMTPAMGGAPYPERPGGGKGLAPESALDACDGSSKLGADARCGDAQLVAALAVVATGGEGEDHEVLLGDEPHDGQHLVGVDADLVDGSGLEELGGILHLPQHR